MKKRALQIHVREHAGKRESIDGKVCHGDLSIDTAVRLSQARELPLEQLLQLCLQRRHEQLWTEFVRRSHSIIAGVVVRTARRWTRPSPTLIDDLVQETYLKLCLNNFRALRQFVSHHENAIFGFLKVVASNTVQDHFRGSQSQKRGSGLPEIQLDFTRLPEALDCRFEDLERRVLLQTIDKCLEANADHPNYARDRVIFWLYYRHGLTAKAISRLRPIGLTLKGVESTILRIVRVVRLKLTQDPAWAAQEEITAGKGQLEDIRAVARS